MSDRIGYALPEDSRPRMPEAQPGDPIVNAIVAVMTHADAIQSALAAMNAERDQLLADVERAEESAHVAECENERMAEMLEAAEAQAAAMTAEYARRGEALAEMQDEAVKWKADAERLAGALDAIAGEGKPGAPALLAYYHTGEAPGHEDACEAPEVCGHCLAVREARTALAAHRAGGGK